MKSNDELKDIDIKNHTCYYFCDIIKVVDINFSHVLLDEKSHANILIYNISYKNLMGAKPLCVFFNKIDGFIKVDDRTRYIVLFGSERYNAIYDRINYLISEKSKKKWY